ncbi:MAG: hypothetical protein KGJ79_00870 [Alphaproteobacteria bacterium]|nr:hypothetical protein [Alphaproteobacteria bacterium]MDE2109665.1 hypothetical protein [Alphaproteobacteria bacterium]
MVFILGISVSFSFLGGRIPFDKLEVMHRPWTIWSRHGMPFRRAARKKARLIRKARVFARRGEGLTRFRHNPAHHGARMTACGGVLHVDTEAYEGEPDAGVVSLLAGSLAYGLGERTPHDPQMFAQVLGKILHFMIYFWFASFTTLTVSVRGSAFWPVLGLIVLGRVLEVLQGFTDGDPYIFDKCANTPEAVAGGSLGWPIVTMLRSKTLTVPFSPRE